MNQYLLHGKLVAKQGCAEELAHILIKASKLVSTVKGCRLYAVSKDKDYAQEVFITEIWDSKEDHYKALNIQGVRELIMQAMPLLDSQPTKGQELEILGETGI